MRYGSLISNFSFGGQNKIFVDFLIPGKYNIPMIIESCFGFYYIPMIIESYLGFYNILMIIEF